MKQIEKGLISGKEALIALANGEEVEFYYIGDWHSLIYSNVHVKCVLNESYKFRIKPKTILLNGIEIPAPFEPKDGDEVYFIDCVTSEGYSSDVIGRGCEDRWIQFGAWRTEDEIKQVVAALLKVFKGE